MRFLWLKFKPKHVAPGEATAISRWCRWLFRNLCNQKVASALVAFTLCGLHWISNYGGNYNLAAYQVLNTSNTMWKYIRTVSHHISTWAAINISASNSSSLVFCWKLRCKGLSQFFFSIFLQVNVDAMDVKIEFFIYSFIYTLRSVTVSNVVHFAALTTFICFALRVIAYKIQLKITACNKSKKLNFWNYIVFLFLYHILKLASYISKMLIWILFVEIIEIKSINQYRVQKIFQVCVTFSFELFHQQSLENSWNSLQTILKLKILFW